MRRAHVSSIAFDALVAPVTAGRQVKIFRRVAVSVAPFALYGPSIQT
jgi:hypothetical protein